MKRTLKILCISAVVLSATILIGGSLPQVPSGSKVVVAPMNSGKTSDVTKYLPRTST